MLQPGLQSMHLHVMSARASNQVAVRNFPTTLSISFGVPVLQAGSYD